MTSSNTRGVTHCKNQPPLNLYFSPLNFFRKALGRDGTIYEDKIKAVFEKKILSLIRVWTNT